MQNSETTDGTPPRSDAVVDENERSVTQHLQAALTADSEAMKDYHIRAALQALVVAEAAPD